MTRQTRSQEGVITEVELIGNVKVPSFQGKSYMPEMGGRLGPPPRPSFALTARRTGRSGRCSSGCCGRGTRMPRALDGRDGRRVASTEMAFCAPVERCPRGFVARRSGPCRAGKGRVAERHSQTSTCLAAADQGTQESFRAHRSRLERYARRRPKSSAERPNDCEEDRTLRAVLVGMLRESDH
jgi:hypothetical protein